jgi:chorismate mutase/prephenate dehydratase
MHSLLPTDAGPLSEPPANLPSDLAGLRAELDRLDDALHDLVMQRARVVEQVGAIGVKGRVALRPGREASIIRRLLERHTGRLPRSTIVRMWRELVAGTTAMQGPFAIAVCDSDPARAYSAAAHEHFGALVPMQVHRTPAQAIGQVSAGLAAAAVLPMPAEGELPGAAWWTALLHHDDPRIHVTARLPFWSQRPEGAPRVQALVVTAVPPDPSGADRSLLGLEVALEVSRDRLGQALTAAGFEPGTTILRRDPGAPDAHALVDVAGLVADDDPRLARLTAILRPPIVLGAYAVPLSAAMTSNGTPSQGAV